MKIVLSMLLSTLLIAILTAAPAVAADIPTIHADPGACMTGPEAQFGRYIGDWKIADETRAQDGSGWVPGKGARWTFRCVGPGVAIQDYWQPNSGGFGTNLRTYNPDTESWEIVWVAEKLNGLQHISAQQSDDGSIVMYFVSPVSDPPKRIIFFPPSDSGWNWAQQWSFDGGSTWVDVYRMKATRWEE